MWSQEMSIECIEIENGAHQYNQGNKDNQTSDNLIDDHDAIGVKATSDFVDEPCQSKPPQ